MIFVIEIVQLPLKPAEDALLLDSTELTIDDVIKQALEHISRVMNSPLELNSFIQGLNKHLLSAPLLWKLKWSLLT